MIQYALKCDDGHSFDSWFQSAAAYDKLRASGHVACAVCGSGKVEKALMAPRVSHGRGETASDARDTNQQAPSPQEPALPAQSAGGQQANPLSNTSTSPTEQALAALKAHVEKTSDYVGTDFAREARKMHLGDAPERSIWGEAKPEEAKALVEDGIQVAPLPFTPTRKTN